MNYKHNLSKSNYNRIIYLRIAFDLILIKFKSILRTLFINIDLLHPPKTATFQLKVLWQKSKEGNFSLTCYL